MTTTYDSKETVAGQVAGASAGPQAPGWRGQLRTATRSLGYEAGANHLKPTPTVPGAPKAQGDPKKQDDTRTTVQKLLSYGVLDGNVSNAEAAKAFKLLAGLSGPDLKGALAKLPQKFKTRLLGNLPRALWTGPTFSRVLVALGPVAARPYIQSLLSVGIFDWAVSAQDAKDVIALASAMTAAQRLTLYDKLGPKLRKAFQKAIPQDKLGARGAYQAPVRDTSLKKGETRYTVWDELLTLIGSIQSGVMGTHQQGRVRGALDALSAADYKRFKAVADAMSSTVGRAFLFKALSSGNTVADIAWLATEITGKGDHWLIDNLTLADTRAQGTGIKQQYSHTCGVTTAQAVRGEYDPVYALRLRRANANISSVDSRDPSKINPHMAAQQAQMHTTATGGVAGGHKGKIASRSQLAKGVGRWVVDWLNDLANVTGLQYSTVKDPTAATAVSTLTTTLSAGMMTPIVVGNGAGAYTHYVLGMHTRKVGGKQQFQFHDPWDGVTAWKTEDDITRGTLNVAGSNSVTALEVPKAAS